MELSTLDREVFTQRRARLAEALGDRPALIAAGRALPRNYLANTYAFRASSHFLYLVGLPLPGAYLFVDGDAATLFLEPSAADDELWHGPTPSLRAIADATGVGARPVTELPSVLGKRAVATLPLPSHEGSRALEDLLGRPVAPGVLEGDDAHLADAMVSVRLRHDAAAVRQLKRAASATEAAHRAGMRATKPGLREHAVCAAMERELIARGMGTSYQPIVTVHGEVLHNHSHHREIKDGDLLLADVGAESEGGFAGDVTRTWPVSGRFTSSQRAIYEVVLAAERAAIEAVRPGARYRDIHLRAARVMADGLVELGILRGDPAELVEEGAHAIFFPHGVGHLLGLDVHDMEDLGDRAGYAPGRERSAQFGLSYLRLDRDLEPGMAVTIEPGFYAIPALLGPSSPVAELVARRVNREGLERFGDVRGIRIEDDVLVTNEGHEVLSANIPRSVSGVEEAMRT